MVSSYDTERPQPTTGIGWQDEETVAQLATAASRCDHVGRFLLRAARAR